MNSFPVSFRGFCFDFHLGVYFWMAASKNFLLLLNFLVETRWFDLFIVDFGQVFNWFIFLIQQAISCNETLLFNSFLMIAHVTLSMQVIFQFKSSKKSNKCQEASFSRHSYDAETIQLIYNPNKLIDFYVVRFLTERCF